MPSLQNSAGAGKAAKFVAANPLDPMANPFSDYVSNEFVNQIPKKLTIFNLIFVFYLKRMTIQRKFKKKCRKIFKNESQKQWRN